MKAAVLWNGRNYVRAIFLSWNCTGSTFGIAIALQAVTNLASAKLRVRVIEVLQTH